MPLLPTSIDPNVRTVSEHDTDHETLHAVNNVIVAGANVAVFTRTGPLLVTTGVGRFKFPFPVTLINVTAAVNTAPTGSSVILDVNLNGTTIFTTQANRPTIAIGAFQETVDAVPDVTAVANDQYLQVDIDQIGSGVAGSDLTVFVRYSTP